MRDLRPGDKTWIVHGREEILVANVGGHFCAMDNVCSHSGGSLADGSLAGTIVRCPLHGWEYDVTTGCCTHIRDECLRTFPVVTEGEQLFVELP
ncbi:MAG: Rieske (2Fe-2S) protein [Chloroflexota bacterium]|nr:Rieske (2Fe-2S) protein [Chloroflexota bacterium]